jgi:hypothetical protein
LARPLSSSPLFSTLSFIGVHLSLRRHFRIGQSPKGP